MAEPFKNLVNIDTIGALAEALTAVDPASSRLTIRPVTTRPLRPGPQRLVLRVNGVDHGPLDWSLG